LKTLQWKLVLILVLLVGTVVAITGTYLLTGVSGFYEKLFFDGMKAVFAGDFKDEMRRKDGAEIEQYIRARSGPLGLGASRQFYLLDESGSPAPAGNSENLIAALNGETGQRSDRFGEFFDIAIPVQGSDGDYIVYIRDDKTSVAELQRMLFTIIFQSLLFGLGISVLLSILLSKTISKPIEDLTDRARRLSEGDFEGELPVHSSDEIGVLTETFNKMKQTLSDTVQAVERESGKLSALFSHMTDGVAAFDADGRLVHYNSAAMLFLDINEHISPLPDFSELFAGLGVTVGDVLGYNLPEFSERLMAGNGRELRVCFSPYGTESRGDGVIAVVYDVTEQRRLDASRREFVADISHELKTPLTNVKSYVETLMDDRELAEPTRTKFLNVILNETDRMTRLVRDLLTLSKLDYGATDWSAEVFDPGALVENIVDAMTIEAQKKNHRLLHKLGDNLPKLRADRDRLGQVLANIINNSVKYTPDGGKIEVTAERRGKNLHISVSDDGIGVPEDDLPHLFDRFYRVEKARSRDGGGSGLGLAIAKEFVELMGGSISIKSVLNKGTAVTVKLPGYAEDNA